MQVSSIAGRAQGDAGEEPAGVVAADLPGVVGAEQGVAELGGGLFHGLVGAVGGEQDPVHPELNDPVEQRPGVAVPAL